MTHQTVAAHMAPAEPTLAQRKAADLRALADLAAAHPEIAEHLFISATLVIGRRETVAGLDPDAVVTAAVEAGGTEVPPLVAPSPSWPERNAALPNHSIRLIVTWFQPVEVPLAPRPTPYPRPHPLAG